MLERYKDVLTVGDLCEVLRIGRNNVYELLKKGEISHMKIRRKYIIPKIAVITYLNSCLTEETGVEKDEDI